MSAVYIVLAIDKFSGVQTCEVYPGFQAASEKAYELSKILVDKTYCNQEHDQYITMIDQFPDEEKTEDGLKWTFISTFDIIVEVYYRNIMSRITNNINNVYYYSWQIGGTLANSSNIQQSLDNPMEENLPAGFSLDGRPIIMKQLFDDPYTVKPVKDLTDNQKWALIIARMKNRPHYIQNIYMKGLGWQNQQSALIHLDARDDQGLIIRDQELKLLDEIRIQELNKNKGYSD